ncbi:hypothetical protein [Streptomyces sp. NPDC058701]|uniref:hypothetical protein n=1 Tax=Streptomyces sp. NPDC058701 TaxID=3346608 RepID=UPI00364F88E4
MPVPARDVRLTPAVAHLLAAAHPAVAFVHVSGEDTDSTERGRSVWARARGWTENELLRPPFGASMFRPGIEQPVCGVPSTTPERVLRPGTPTG